MRFYSGNLRILVLFYYIISVSRDVMTLIFQIPTDRHPLSGPVQRKAPVFYILSLSFQDNSARQPKLLAG